MESVLISAGEPTMKNLYLLLIVFISSACNASIISKEEFVKLIEANRDKLISTEAGDRYKTINKGYLMKGVEYPNGAVYPFEETACELNKETVDVVLKVEDGFAYVLHKGNQISKELYETTVISRDDELEMCDMEKSNSYGYVTLESKEYYNSLVNYLKKEVMTLPISNINYDGEFLVTYDTNLSKKVSFNLQGNIKQLNRTTYDDFGNLWSGLYFESSYIADKVDVNQIDLTNSRLCTGSPSFTFDNECLLEWDKSLAK